MDGCCRTSRPSVFGCFERGLVTRRQPPLPVRGPVVEGPSGLWASFSLEANGERLEHLRFEAASCTTLIACCQALVETLAGRRLPDCGMDAGALADMLPGVPPMQRNRAAIAAGALRAALECIIDSDASTHPQTQESST